MKLPLVKVVAASAMVSASATAGLPYDLSWNSLDGGGVMFADGGGYVLGGTIGQPDAGVALTGGAYSLEGGFWAVEATVRPVCAADLDGSGTVNASDLAQLLGAWGGC